MAPENPSEPTPRRDRRSGLRPVIAVFALLMLAGMLAAALLPGRLQRSSPAVAAPHPADQPAAPTQQTGPTPPAAGPQSPASPAAEPQAAETRGQRSTDPDAAGQGSTGQGSAGQGSAEPGSAPHQADAQLPPAGPLPELPADEPSQLVVHGSRECGLVALTYDAGSGADGAEAILDTLKRQKVTATFFLTGKWAEQFPEVARRIVAEGHEIGNHTYSHPDLTTLAPAEALQQIKDGEAAIAEVTGRDPKPLFREPYGAFNEAERRLVRQAGYSYSIYWEVDTLDWQFPPVETLVQRLTEKPKSGSVVLMHLNVPDTAIASDRAIPLLRAKGLEPTTVSSLLQCRP